MEQTWDTFNERPILWYTNIYPTITPFFRMKVKVAIWFENLGVLEPSNLCISEYDIQGCMCRKWTKGRTLFTGHRDMIIALSCTIKLSSQDFVLTSILWQKESWQQLLPLEKIQIFTEFFE